MSSSSPQASHLALGPVALTVADLAGARAFYERAIGLRTLSDDAGRAATLGAADGVPLVELSGDPDAPPRPRATTGLYHLAILVPGRAELARALQRVISAGWRITGASDHLVSEALYLDDPEGNGIELYRDRPREEWSYDGGELRMATARLDLDGLMRELPGDGDPGMPAGTTMGHVHLNVADLDATEAFYSGVLGLDVTVRSYPSARFLSRGGYHHHLGANVWAGAGAPPPPPGTRGLRHFGFALGGADELAGVREELAGAGLEAREGGRGLLTSDPSGNGILLTA